MKEGWEYKKLKEIGRTQTGTTPSKSVKSYYGGEIPFIRPAELDIDGNGSIEYNSELKLTPEGALKSRMISANSTLMCCIGSVGKTGFSTKDVTCNQQINTITPYEGYNGKFVYYSLLTPLFQKEVIKIANSAKATLAIISKGKWEEMTIPVAPLSEQQSIVDYLDSAFAKIDTMKANAEKALNEAKALFQASLKEMLEPKEGWEEKKLKEVVVSITDGDHQPPPKSDDGIPFITISNIEKNSNKIDFGETFYVPQSYYSALKKDRIPQNGDVLYTVTGSFGIPVLIDFQKEFCFQRHIALIRPNKGLLSPTYLFYWILSSYATSQAEDTATGTAQRTVSLNSLRNFAIHVPTLSEQQSIVDTLDSLKSKVNKLQANYDKISQECDALKQAILKQVFE